LILENKIEDLQRTTRRTSIEIKNVPKISQESTEDLIKMVLGLAKTINLEMEPRDIKDIFRLQTKNERNVRSSPIIVEFGSMILKSNLMKKIKSFNIRNKTKLQAKHLGHATQEDTPVFVSEQLTAKAARLFFLARDLVRTHKYKYCWTSLGRVLVRQDDNSRIIHIVNEAQVNQLMQAT
jgi:hypothetical protein